MSHRFYFPALAPHSDPSTAADFELDRRVTLEGDQAKHAVQVMRFASGDLITLFDGNGLEAKCEIVEASKKKLELAIQSYQERDPVLRSQLSSRRGVTQR